MEYSIEIIKGCSRFVSMNNRIYLLSDPFFSLKLFFALCCLSAEKQ